MEAGAGFGPLLRAATDHPARKRTWVKAVRARWGCCWALVSGQCRCVAACLTVLNSNHVSAVLLLCRSPVQFATNMYRAVQCKSL